MLSFLRILAIVPTAILMLNNLDRYRIYVIILLIFIWLTDTLDGYIARKFNMITETGKIIDPLADKLCIIVIGIIVFKLDLIPLWFLIIIIVRDLLILLFGLYTTVKYKITLMSNYPGKVAALMIGIILLLSITNIELLKTINSYLIYIAILLILYSTYIYLKRFLKTIGDKKYE
ncbi:MAG: CDP-alcohol phosphatidyltransferase family protein [Ignavibacteria bacterium]|nr:CDP-alcohol phosphatidyltransferase family protein [Ignavibacteria bacterium]